MLYNKQNEHKAYQDGDGGDDGEGREGDETEPVDDHGRKLPVADDFHLLHNVKFKFTSKVSKSYTVLYIFEITKLFLKRHCFLEQTCMKLIPHR